MTTAICIYGLPGSGKSTFVDVAKEIGLETIIMGDVVRSKAHDANVRRYWVVNYLHIAETPVVHAGEEVTC